MGWASFLKILLALCCGSSRVFGSPQMWGWPQLPFGGPRPKQFEEPSLQPPPFPPRPPPSSPFPPWLFAKCSRSGGLGWRGEVTHSGGGGAIQAALGARPTFGGIRGLHLCHRISSRPPPLAFLVLACFPPDTFHASARRRSTGKNQYW